MAFLLAIQKSQALPNGNPAEPNLLVDGFVYKGFWEETEESKTPWHELFSFRFGFYGDYVFNKYLSVDSIEDDPSIEKSSLSTNSALLTVNFWDKFDLFGTLGAAHITLKGNSSSLSSPIDGSRFYLDCGSDFAWSLGGRALAWTCGFTAVGVELQYFQVAPDVSRISISELVSVYPDKLRAKYREWQIGMGISQRIFRFVPYVALKWSHAKLKIKDFAFSSPLLGPARARRFESEKIMGCALGVSWVDIERASVTAEARFGDEIALHVNGQVRF